MTKIKSKKKFRSRFSRRPCRSPPPRTEDNLPWAGRRRGGGTPDPEDKQFRVDEGARRRGGVETPPQKTTCPGQAVAGRGGRGDPHGRQEFARLRWEINRWLFEYISFPALELPT